MYIRKNASTYTYGPKYGKIYHSFDGFLTLHVQNVCVEAILISLNPILIEFVMILSYAPFEDVSSINASELGPGHIYRYQECVILGKHRRLWYDSMFSSASTLFVYVPFTNPLRLFDTCVL